MGFIKQFWKDSHEQVVDSWGILESGEQLEQIMRDSHKKPVGIFKHSTRCGISVRAKHLLEEGWEYQAEELDFYYLDLLQHRELSNKVAELTGVPHQSPQVILIRNGEPVYEETHHDINASEFREYL